MEQSALYLPHQYNDNNKWKVHALSLLCILTETAAVLMGSVCGILFIYCMDGDIKL